MNLDQIFQQFLQEKTYLQNCSRNTIKYYEGCFIAYRKFVGAEMPTREVINTLIIRMRESGLSIGGCNTYLRGLNTVLKWMKASEYIEDNITIKLLKQEKLVMRSFSEEELRRLIAFRPQKFGERRMHTLICLLIDTGVRIEEALTLTRDKINLDNLTMTVFGKGSKERVVPISLELRKILFKYLNTHKFDLVFCTRQGMKFDYFNARTDFRLLCKKLHIQSEGFHCFRRTFARNYLKRGGNLFYLQAAMGHSRLETTRRYVEVELEDLKRTHTSVSLLSRLR